MKKRTGIAILIMLLLSVMIFFNNDFPPFQFLSKSVQEIFKPAKNLIYGIKVGTNGESAGVNKKLLDENASLQKKLIEFEMLKKDNEVLKSQFESEINKTYKLLPAQVIGYLGSFSNPTTLIIDKGEADGVKSGMAIVFQDNFSGKVSRVSPNYSQVTLPINSKISVLGVTAEGGVPGLVIGQEDFILFDRVAISETMKEGETVLTKGEIDANGIGVPPDLVIGRISSVNKSETLPFQTAKLESELQFSKLAKVFIVLGL
jgi:rod shape-determining protein MreC